MSVRRKCPQVYWSQTDNDIRLIVDLLLDDMVCVNMFCFVLFETQFFMFHLYLQ